MSGFAGHSETLTVCLTCAKDEQDKNPGLILAPPTNLDLNLPIFKIGITFAFSYLAETFL